MQKIQVTRGQEGSWIFLDIRFKALSQLLDPDDHTPLPDQELTTFAEETIAGYLDEYPVRRPIRLMLGVPEEDLSPGRALLVTEAVRRHFSFRVTDIRHQQILERREGKYSFIIAVINVLIAAVVFSLFYDEFMSGDPFFLFLIGLITILNWVTIWDTYEYFMYDYRNLLRKRRIYQKIAKIPVTVAGYASQKTD